MSKIVISPLSVRPRHSEWIQQVFESETLCSCRSAVEHSPGREDTPWPERSGWSLWAALWGRSSPWRGSTALTAAPPAAQSCTCERLRYNTQNQTLIRLQYRAVLYELQLILMKPSSHRSQPSSFHSHPPIKIPIPKSSQLSCCAVWLAFTQNWYNYTACLWENLKVCWLLWPWQEKNHIGLVS